MSWPMCENTKHEKGIHPGWTQVHLKTLCTHIYTKWLESTITLPACLGIRGNVENLNEIHRDMWKTRYVRDIPDSASSKTVRDVLRLADICRKDSSCQAILSVIGSLNDLFYRLKLQNLHNWAKDLIKRKQRASKILGF